MLWGVNVVHLFVHMDGVSPHPKPLSQLLVPRWERGFNVRLFIFLCVFALPEVGVVFLYIAVDEHGATADTLSWIFSSFESLL